MFVYRVRKYLGAYLLRLKLDVDAIVFSGGIGERSAAIRSAVCDNLGAFGIQLDEAENEGHDGATLKIVSDEDKSDIDVLVVPTDEELCIAQDTAHLVGTK